MFCTKCGTELPDDSQFCRKCGQPLGEPTTTSAKTSGAATGVAPAPVPETPAAAQPSGRNPAIWVVLGVVVIVIIGIFLVNWPDADKQKDDVQRQMATMPVIKHMTAVVIGAPFVVEPHQYRYIRMEVPSRSSNVHLQGHVTATGGGGNDVEVYLVDEDGLVNWKNHHAMNAVYNSGRVTQATVDVVLPNDAKTYYLVVSNVFSVLSNKAVSGDIKLYYDQPQ
jgi:hypothetical protein